MIIDNLELTELRSDSFAKYKTVKISIAKGSDAAFLREQEALDLILHLASVFKITDKEILEHFTNGG